MKTNKMNNYRYNDVAHLLTEASDQTSRNMDGEHEITTPSVAAFHTYKLCTDVVAENRRTSFNVLSAYLFCIIMIAPYLLPGTLN
jgi:hypothetical protein